MNDQRALPEADPAEDFKLVDAPQEEQSKMADNDMQAELARLKAENAALKARASGPLTLKVSQKGAVSVYGMGRFPVTLYKEQWERLLDMADDIRAFIEQNAAKLKTLDG